MDELKINEIVKIEGIKEIKIKLLLEPFVDLLDSLLVKEAAKAGGSHFEAFNIAHTVVANLFVIITNIINAGNDKKTINENLDNVFTQIRREVIARNKEPSDG